MEDPPLLPKTYSRLAVEGRQQLMDVLGQHVERHLRVRILYGAAQDAAGVVGDDGEMLGEERGDSRESPAAHGRADQQEQGARATGLVPQMCAR